jgi:hypothetical protein
MPLFQISETSLNFCLDPHSTFSVCRSPGIDDVIIVWPSKAFLPRKSKKQEPGQETASNWTCNNAYKRARFYGFKKFSGDNRLAREAQGNQWLAWVRRNLTTHYRPENEWHSCLRIL